MCSERTGVGVVVAVSLCLLLNGMAAAEVTTDRSGSILVFPKVIADGTRDTIIQITNVSNSLVRAHCFYVNAALTDPTQPQGPDNPPLWQEVDFTIALTRQQPTHWVVSQGRNVNPFDTPCGTQGICLPDDGGFGSGASAAPGDPCTNDSRCICSNTRCGEAGFDPGLIPPVVPDFEGELKCVQVDDSGAPLSGNHLKGEATLVQVDDRAFAITSEDSFTLALVLSIGPQPPVRIISGDVSKYNGLAIVGNDNNGDGTLVLGGGQCVGDGAASGAVCRSDEECGDAGPCALEYNACPQTWILNHLATGAPDLALEDSGVPITGSAVDTELTVVPCTQNFETQEPSRVTLQFDTTDEFESRFSVSTTVECWGNFSLGEVGATALTFAGTLVPDPQGTMYLQTRIRSAGGTPVGALMVAEEIHTVTAKPDHFTLGSTAAVNLHVEGERPVPDVITIPDEQIAP